MKKHFVLFCLTLLCLRAGAQLSDTTNWKTQVDRQFFSTLLYPPDWELSYLDDGYLLTSPKENDSDQYRENVSFFAMEVPDTVMKQDPKDFAEASFVQMKKSLQDVRVMVHKNITTNGLPMYLIVFNGVSNGQYLYWKQMYCLYNNVAYMVTYTGQAGKKDHFAIAGGDVLNSFTPLFTKRG